MLLCSELLDEVGLFSQTAGFIPASFFLFYVGFLAELGPQFRLSFDFHGKFSSGRFTAQLLCLARLMLWNAG